MNRLFSSFALLLGMTVAATAAPPPARPHIVLVLADDLGPGDLGCYGGQVAATPNIDRLAAEGIRFTQAYTAAPICSASRCGLLTGQWPGRWRITSFLQHKAGNRRSEQADYLDPAAPSLPRALRAAGYRTAHVGKWHLGGGRDVDGAPGFAAYGYDEFASTWESPAPHPELTATDWIWSDQDKVKRWERSGFFVDTTLDFLRRNKDAPCFVNLWLDDPHTPWVPDAAAGRGATTAENLREVMTELDRQMGRLTAGLKELGIGRRTLVIFASDNGPGPTLGELRSAGLRGSKLSLYEGGMRSPLIARWPGVLPAGETDATTVLAAVDLFPTLCRAAGAELPDGMQPDGEDRWDALSGKPAAERRGPLFWEYGRNESFSHPRQRPDRSPNLAMRDGDWKLLVNDDGTGAELYDLATDVGETRDVAGDHPEVVERLRRTVLQWRRALP